MTKQALESVLPDGADSSKIGYLDPERIQQPIDLGKESGLISKNMDINDSIDRFYWEEAMGQQP